MEGNRWNAQILDYSTFHWVARNLVASRVMEQTKRIRIGEVGCVVLNQVVIPPRLTLESTRDFRKLQPQGSHHYFGGGNGPKGLSCAGIGQVIPGFSESGWNFGKTNGRNFGPNSFPRNTKSRCTLTSVCFRKCKKSTARYWKSDWNLAYPKNSRMRLIWRHLQ